ncbi:formin-like protein 2, partial [Hypanus sabinus]|uniref:formin-like protein 2 n=1 Tax=Hypanus sabinus TaxID=79690 RepID=UPI0028C4DE55
AMESDTVCPCAENMFFDVRTEDCKDCESCEGVVQCKLCKGGSPYFLLSIISSSIALGTLLVGAGYLISHRTSRGCKWPLSGRARSRDPFHSEVKGSTPEVSCFLRGPSFPPAPAFPFPPRPSPPPPAPLPPPPWDTPFPSP